MVRPCGVGGWRLRVAGPRRGRAFSGSYTMPGAIATFDTSHPLGLYQDTARTTLASATGDPIRSFTDFSGNGNHVPLLSGAPWAVGNRAWPRYAKMSGRDGLSTARGDYQKATFTNVDRANFTMAWRFVYVSIAYNHAPIYMAASGKSLNIYLREPDQILSSSEASLEIQIDGGAFVQFGQGRLDPSTAHTMVIIGSGTTMRCRVDGVETSITGVAAATLNLLLTFNLSPYSSQMDWLKFGIWDHAATDAELSYLESGWAGAASSGLIHDRTKPLVHWDGNSLTWGIGNTSSLAVMGYT